MKALETFFAILHQLFDAAGSVFWAAKECLRIYREWMEPDDDEEPEVKRKKG